ncbi:MAG: HNH endonuclease [Candidatus Krumholzibacteriota bacterium]|nr:HNH endonuclease [Candidatus Krumholzibacteriota bacterium]
MLCRGEINLSTVSLVSEVITSGNRKEILSGIKNRSTRSAKILLSKYNPRTIIRDKVTPVYIMKKVSDSGNHGSNSGKEKTISQGDEPSSGMTDGKNFTSDVGGQKSSTLNSVKSGGQTGTSEPEKIGVDKPLPRVIMEQKFRLEFAVAPAFMDKVKRVRELLSTKYPEGLQYERVFEILMDEYIERRSSESRRERRKIGKKQRTAAQKPEQTVQRRRMPASRKSESIQGTKSAQNSQSIQGAKQVRKSKSVQKAKSIRQAKSILNSDFRPEKSKYKRSRYIPASVRDEVFARDGNRCTYVSPQGKRCNSSWNLEIDHIIPYARGGGNNLENLRLLCPRHNRMEAERVYGREFMGRYNRRE